MNTETNGPFLFLFVMFWTVMIFLSIAWYGFLIFYIGFKGGREIKAMTKTLARREETDKLGPVG